MTDREKVIRDVEEAIEILGKVDEPMFWLDFVRVAVENALKLLKGQTTSGWVSVKDRMPDKPCGCLVFNINGWGALDFWEGDGWKISYENEITHWMPLPAPPEEMNEDA